MNKLYIYRLDDNVHVATITAEDNDACESEAVIRFSSDDYGWTYSPAFGMADGLAENPAAAEIG